MTEKCKQYLTPVCNLSGNAIRSVSKMNRQNSDHKALTLATRRLVFDAKSGKSAT